MKEYESANHYQRDSRITWRHIDTGVSPEIDVYCVLGLLNEAGELAGKIKKIFRDKNAFVGEDDREEIKLEMGDIVWYLTQIATGLGIDLSEILQANIGKITDRQRRGVIGGNGDKR
mgnify:CR=1 FL=1